MVSAVSLFLQASAVSDGDTVRPGPSGSAYEFPTRIGVSLYESIDSGIPLGIYILVGCMRLQGSRLRFAINLLDLIDPRLGIADMRI
jgi:hypothetical protein